jgi:hypothetical protein
MKDNNTTNVIFKVNGDAYDPTPYNIKGVDGTKKLQPNPKENQVHDIVHRVYENDKTNNLDIIITSNLSSINNSEMSYLENIKCREQTIYEDRLTFMSKVVCFYRFTRELSVEEIQLKMKWKESNFSGHFKLCLIAYNIGNNNTDSQKVTKMQNIWIKHYSLWVDPFEFSRNIVVTFP